MNKLYQIANTIYKRKKGKYQMANRKLFNEMCRYADSGKDEYFKRGQFMSCEEMSMRMGCDLTGPTLMSMVNAGWIMVRKP
jgi:hypothetical protein